MTVLDNIESYDYGKFDHILDIEGNKIELWEAKDWVNICIKSRGYSHPLLFYSSIIKPNQILTCPYDSHFLPYNWYALEKHKLQIDNRNIKFSAQM